MRGGETLDGCVQALHPGVQRNELALEFVETSLHVPEAFVDFIETAVYLFETAVYVFKTPVDLFEPAVMFLELAIDRTEALVQISGQATLKIKHSPEQFAGGGFSHRVFIRYECCREASWACKKTVKAAEPNGPSARILFMGVG